MRPIKTNESNFTYTGPSPEVADLPCRIDQTAAGPVTHAVFALDDEDRRIIAAGGNIRLGIYGARPIPPVSLAAAPDVGPTGRVPAPCAVCGEEPTDAMHGGGSDTHAYRVPRGGNAGCERCGRPVGDPGHDAHAGSHAYVPRGAPALDSRPPGPEHVPWPANRPRPVG